MSSQASQALERRLIEGEAAESFAVHTLDTPSRQDASAVILLPAIAGVNGYIAEVAARLAGDGHRVVAIDYFSRAGEVPDLSSPELIGRAVAAVDDRQVLADVGAAARWLTSQGVARERIGVLGFCIGGTYAVLSAAREDGIGCAVAYYGQLRYGVRTAFKPVDPLDVAKDLRVPLLGHFGERDRLISGDDIAAFAAQLFTGPGAHELFTYRGAPHAFDESFRPAVYRPVASREAWQRTRAFLGWHLAQRHPAN